ncbi:MAG: hypothetical protein WKF89_10175 [Chitinophagaceae bacterium]
MIIHESNAGKKLFTATNRLNNAVFSKSNMGNMNYETGDFTYRKKKEITPGSAVPCSALFKYD